MEKDSLLKAILLVSVILLLAAIGWTWLEIMPYWQSSAGGTASVQQRSSRVASTSHIDALRRS